MEDIGWLYVEYVMMRELHQQKSEIDNMSLDEVVALVEIHKKELERENEEMKRELRRYG